MSAFTGICIDFYDTNHPDQVVTSWPQSFVIPRVGEYVRLVGRKRKTDRLMLVEIVETSPPLSSLGGDEFEPCQQRIKIAVCPTLHK